MCDMHLDEVAYRIVENPWFDRTIIAVITVNCVILALNDPTKGAEDQSHFMDVVDILFSGIFIAELLLKWLALSISAYFKDRWNW